MTFDFYVRYHILKLGERYALLLARDYTLNEINKFFKQKKLYLNEDIAYEIIKWLQSKMRR